MSGHEPVGAELVACALRCIVCQFEYVQGLPADAPARTTLSGLACARCDRKGGVRMASPQPRPRPVLWPLTPPPPSRGAEPIGIHDEPPDDVGDEDLAARRSWSPRR